MALQPGLILHNRYRIESTLGQGGMGAVYKASDTNLGVPVAVKENLFTTEEYARQFRREATILASLRHPNLPRVTDHFVIEGEGQYLVMDFIDGGDLRHRLERSGPVGEAEALPLFLEICDALIYLHSRTAAILHRDIKPGNIKITPDGRAILVDFGLAKVADSSGSTATGAKAMTPGFSPPEQYGTGRTDPRTDVYSLGATMYTALSACVPEDSLERAMGRAQLTPLRKRVPEISSGTAKAIEKALAVRPEERYQTAAEFASALSSSSGASRPTVVRNYPYLERTMVSPRKTAPVKPLAEGPRPRRRWVTGLVAGLAVFLVIVGAAFAGPEIKARLAAMLAATAVTPTLADTIPPTAAEPSLTPTTGFAVIVPDQTPGAGDTPTVPSDLGATPSPTYPPTAALTPTGGGLGQVAFASNRDGLPQIYLINLDGTGLFQVTDLQDGACQPSWSPDGTQLVFTSPCPGNQDRYPGSSLWVINADRSGLRTLPTAPGGDFDPAWGPDGVRIAFTSLRDGYPQIYVMNADGSGVQSLSDNHAYDAQPAWSPMGNQLLFTRVTATVAIWIMTDQGQAQETLSRSGDRESTHPDWSSDGQVIIFDRRMGGIPRLLATLFSDRGLNEAQVCPQGQRSVQPMAEPDWSIDGKWIVFETWPTGLTHDIGIISSSCTNFTLLTEDVARDFDAAWRP